MSKDKKYYIIDRQMLPNSVQGVIKVNDLVQHEQLTKNEAIKKTGISKSTYYKYKDYIRPFFEGEKVRVFNIHILLEDRLGILSKIFDIIAEAEMNVLTINQNIPIEGVSDSTISLENTSDSLRKIEVMLEKISSIKGVKELRVVGGNGFTF